MTDDVEAIRQAIRKSAVDEVYVERILDSSGFIVDGVFDFALFIAALRSLGWQKVGPGMVVVKKPSHDWVKSTLGHGDAMCRKCFISNREAFVLGLMDKCEGVTNDAADNKKPAP